MEKKFVFKNAPSGGSTIFNFDSAPGIIRRCHIEPMGYGGKQKPTLWDRIKAFFGYSFIPKRGYNCSLHIDENLLENVKMEFICPGDMLIDNNGVTWRVRTINDRKNDLFLTSAQLLNFHPTPFQSFIIICNSL